MIRNFLVATVIIVLGATVPVLAIGPGDRPSFGVDDESSTPDDRPHGNDDPVDLSDDARRFGLNSSE